MTVDVSSRENLAASSGHPERRVIRVTVKAEHAVGACEALRDFVVVVFGQGKCIATGEVVTSTVGRSDATRSAE